MSVIAEQMQSALLEFGSGPTLEEMPRRTLQDKLLNGPTAAHRIEEIHTPFNYAYITCTTGSSAFQNLVGVTKQELPARAAAGKLALERAGLRAGDTLLITYPPLVSVFSREALDQEGICVRFLLRPSRDALITALLVDRPNAVLGESSFLRAALVDARRLKVTEELPERLIFLAAGSPMDPLLAEEADRLHRACVHDLYGCQEFGWLCMDGAPLRKDLTLWDVGRADTKHLLLVGGLPTGDCFFIQTGQNGSQRILTQTRERTKAEAEVTVLDSVASDIETVRRTARSILRIKAKIVRTSEHLQCRASATRLLVSVPGTHTNVMIIGPEKTELFDELLEAQMAYQREARSDPVWNKPW